MTVLFTLGVGIATGYIVRSYKTTKYIWEPIWTQFLFLSTKTIYMITPLSKLKKYTNFAFLISANGFGVFWNLHWIWFEIYHRCDNIYSSFITFKCQNTIEVLNSNFCCPSAPKHVSLSFFLFLFTALPYKCKCWVSCKISSSNVVFYDGWSVCTPLKPRRNICWLRRGVGRGRCVHRMHGSDICSFGVTVPLVVQLILCL